MHYIKVGMAILNHTLKSEKDSHFQRSQYSPANCLLEKPTHYSLDVTVACYTTVSHMERRGLKLHY